ncbi:MAG: hypothetical protein ACRCS6_05335 [Turicibacter sp.]
MRNKKFYMCISMNIMFKRLSYKSKLVATIDSTHRDETGCNYDSTRESS